MRGPSRPALSVLAPALALALALAACGDPGAPAPPPPASLRVVDGDTVVWDGAVRDLAGIDAPELGQSCEAGGRPYPCGLDAAFALAKRVALEPAACEPARGADEADAGALGAVVCHVGATSLADLQVSDGYAFALPGAPQGLRVSEAEAERAHLGVWRGAHVSPGAWRAGTRLPSDAKSGAGAPCPVIGVPGGGGVAYLVPTDAAYGRRANEQGLPRACSDEEARARGWRRPGERAGPGPGSAR